MKAAIFGSLVLWASWTQASEQVEVHNYLCLANTLQAINSDIYYNLQVEEMDALIKEQRAIPSSFIINTVLKKCDSLN